MRKAYLLIALIILSLVANAQQWQWVSSICGNMGAGDRIVQADNGYTYVSGRIMGTFQLPNYTLSDTGVFIAQYDPQGNLMWIDTIHGDYVNSHQRLQIDSAGNCYYSFYGNESGKGVVKYSFTGERKWLVSAYGGIISDMEIASSGDIYIAGWYSSHTAFCDTVLSAPHGDLWTYLETYIAKIDSNGSCIWVRGIPGSEGMIPSITCDDDGNAYLASRVRDTARFDANIILTTPGCFIAKYDGAGNCLMAKSISASINQKTFFLERAAATGDLYLGGDFSGTIDFGSANMTSAGDDIYILKMDSLGNYTWSKHIMGGHIFSMLTDEHGDLYMNGSIGGSNNFGNGYSNTGNDMLIVRFSPSGQCSGLWSLGHAYSPYVSSMSVNNDKIGVTGSFQDSLIYGSFQMYCPPTNNVFAGVFTVAPMSAHEVQSDGSALSIYPNPAEEHFTVHSLYGGTIIIRDITGREMYRKEKASAGETISLDNFSNGIYMVEVSDGKNKTCRKLIVQK